MLQIAGAGRCIMALSYQIRGIELDSRPGGRVPGRLMRQAHAQTLMKRLQAA